MGSVDLWLLELGNNIDDLLLTSSFGALYIVSIWYFYISRDHNMCDRYQINIFPAVKFCAGEGAYSKTYVYKFFHPSSFCLSRCQFSHVWFC